MVCHPLAKVRRVTDVTLIGVAQALDDLCVEHITACHPSLGTRFVESPPSPSLRRTSLAWTLALLGFQAKDGVPSRTLTSNLEFRTLPLCALSYGDKKTNPWLVSSTSSHPALSKSASIMKGLGRSIYFAFRGSKWLVRASGNAPDPGTHLVRLRL